MTLECSNNRSANFASINHSLKQSNSTLGIYQPDAWWNRFPGWLNCIKFCLTLLELKTLHEWFKFTQGSFFRSYFSNFTVLSESWFWLQTAALHHILHDPVWSKNNIISFISCLKQPSGDVSKWWLHIRLLRAKRRNMVYVRGQMPAQQPAELWP